jgi:hypothetical protein
MGLGNTFSLLRFIANHPLNRDQKLRAGAFCALADFTANLE